jgi:Na+/melibiose symporter-like transporter
MAEGSLRPATKLAYAIGAAAESGIGIAFNAFNFLFYTTVLGMSGTLAGLAVTIALVFDAVSDPLVGSISDRWRSPFGRRHPFLYAAPIPMALSFVAIYSPPAGLSQPLLFVWFTTFTVLLRTAQTLYQVPHLALGAEMTTSYQERSVLMSWNTACTMIGTFGVYYLAWTWFGTLEVGTADPRGYRVMAIAIGLFAIAAVFASAWFTRDQIPRLSQPAADAPGLGLSSLFGEMRECLRIRNFRVLVYGIFFLSATLGLHETLSSHINLFFWELSPDEIRYMIIGAPPGLLLATLFTPRFHALFGKRNGLIAGILGMAGAVAVPVALRLLGAFPENDSPQLFPILVSLKSASYCMSAVMLISIASTLADVTDEHELETGRRQEGIFFAARAFFGKLTSGLGHLLAGLGMDLIDFPTDARPGTLDPEVVFNFGLLAGPLAVLPAIMSVFFYLRYDIDESRHAEIRTAIAAHARGGSVSGRTREPRSDSC